MRSSRDFIACLSTARSSRRGFLKGVAAATWVPHAGTAQSGAGVPELSGREFDLVVDWLPVNFTGRRRRATAVNGSVPGPTLRWREGDTVTLRVTNRLPVPTSIHWHGMRIPAEMDGVPGLTFRGIAPGETFVYRFPVLQSGTYWYHSHSAFQEQTGLWGALVIEPREAEPVEFDRDYVVMLSDWTDENPDTVYSNLKKQSDYYNYHQRTAGTFVSDAKSKGVGATVADRLRWGRGNMSPNDIADVTSATYTYLMNGKPPRDNWTALFEPGQRVRLRFINASSMTLFDVRIPGLAMTVVEADGNAVEPVTVDEFRMGVAETYDVIVQPAAGTAYTLFAQPESRGGYACGTLAPRMGMKAAIPPLDPVPVRTMADMGMGAMKGGSMAGMKGMDQESMPGMQMPMPPAAGSGMASGMMPHDAQTVACASVGTQPFRQPGPRSPRLAPMCGGMTMPGQPEPAALRTGPSVAMVAMHPTARLNDPGDGLEGNGRRVLTYSDLRARYRGVDGRQPSREIVFHVTGNMERFVWGFDGYRFSSVPPVHLKLGERVRFVLINDTMMEHPIHLHGLWSELENGQGEFQPYKHTITIKPAERVSYLVSADTPGRWAYHCHLLYHMAAGMFRTVIVS